MDLIKVPKVENVQLEQGQTTSLGTLHLTAHHLIFHPLSTKLNETWISYPTIHAVEKGLPTASGAWPLHIRCHHFVFVCFSFKREKDASDVYESIQKLTCRGSVDELYAFFFSKKFTTTDGWQVYNPKAEYERMGVGVENSQWRFSEVNQSYSFSPTYPHVIVVPSKISDTALQYAAKYRSKARIPALSYLHWLNKASITRCSQPMVGLKQNRSIQDEKLIEAIFMTTVEPPKEGQRVYSNTTTNLIIDARPTANAVVNTAVGAGTENMENYRNCKKSYSGIENIHVMRESLNKLVEALQELDQKGRVSKATLQKSGWLKHIAAVMEGSNMIVRNIHISSSHVLVHCSDGWDRTAQLTSIAQVCLDKHYRTLRGFQVLVEKEWCSFGHKFMDRCGHLSNDKNFVSLSATNSAANTFANVQSKLYNNKHIRETSPVFQQFLDCVYQIMYQYPTRFEFNENFLIQLHYHVYSCQFGNFLFNCERERELRYQAAAKTASIWDCINSEKDKYLNPEFDPTADCITEGDQGVLLPDAKAVRYWSGLFHRKDDELNGLEDIPGTSVGTPGAGAPGERMTSEMLGIPYNLAEATMLATSADEAAELAVGGGGQDALEASIEAGITSQTNGVGRVSSPALSSPLTATSDPLGLGTVFDSRSRPSARGGRANNFSEGLTTDDAWNAAKASAAAIGGGLVDTFSRFRDTWYSPSVPPTSSSSTLSGGVGDSDDGGVQGSGGGAMFGQRNRSATLGRSHSNRRKGTVDRELTSVAGHVPKPAFDIPIGESSSPRPSLAALTLENEIYAGRSRAASTSRSESPAARLGSSGSVTTSQNSRAAGVRSPRTSSPAPGVQAAAAAGGARGYDPLSSPTTFAPPLPRPLSRPSSPPLHSNDHPFSMSPRAAAVMAEPLPSISSNGSGRSPPQTTRTVTTTLVQEPSEESIATATALVGEISLAPTEPVGTPPSVADSTPVKELPHPLFIE